MDHSATARAEGCRAAFAIIVIAALAVLLREMLSHYSFWFDEFASLIFADQPLSNLWGTWMVRETNPPLFYTMLKGWQGLFGHTPEAARLLTICGGGLQVALMGAVGHRLYGWRGGIAAAAIVAIAGEAINFSHLLRGYIFASDAALVSLLGLLVWLDGGQRRLVGLALYALGGAAAFYFHTTMALWPAAASTAIAALYWQDMRKDRWRMLRELALANLAIVAIASWWLWITAHQIGANRNIRWIKALSLKDFVYVVSHGAMAAIDTGPQDKLAQWTMRLGMVGAVLLLRRDRRTWLLLAMLALAVVAYKAASLVQPIVTSRTIFWMTMFPVLIIAGGIARLRPAWASWTVLAALVAVLGLNLRNHVGDFERQPWETAFAAMASHPGSVMLVEAVPMALVADRACTLHFTMPRCPVPIVALESGQTGDSWAYGITPVELATPAALPQQLARSTGVFAIHHGGYHPLLTLGLVPPSSRLDWNKPFVEGPIDPARFGAEQPAAR